MPSPEHLRRLALASAALGVAALSGCAAVSPSSPPVGTQSSPLAPVAIELPFCTTARELDGPPQDPATESCRPFEGRYAGDGTRRPFTSPGSGRLLVVAEVADGTPDPVLRLRRTPDTPLVRDDAVVDPGLRPAADGHHWVGYRSALVTYLPGARDAGDVVQTSASAHTADAAAVRSLGVGDQVVRDGFGADLGDRAVDCAEPGATSSPSVLSSITCPTSPVPVDAGVVTDAAVSPPDATATVTAGTRVRVPFTVQLVGTVAAPSVLRVDADAAIPGAETSTDVTAIPWPVTPALPAAPDPGPDPVLVDPWLDPDPAPDPDGPAAGPPAADPGGDTAPAPRPVSDIPDGGVPVAVTVTVPAGTPAGDHTVTLRVRDEAGAARTATGRLRVAAAPAPELAPTPGPTPTPEPAPAPAADPVPTSAVTPRSKELRPIAPVTAAEARTRPGPLTTISTLRTARVDAHRRRLHAGRVTCRSTTRCVASTVVRAGSRRVGLVRFTLAPGAAGAVTRRLSRPATALLLRRGGTATVTVDTGGPQPLVRVTRVVVTTTRRASGPGTRLPRTPRVARRR